VFCLFHHYNSARFCKQFWKRFLPTSVHFLARIYLLIEQKILKIKSHYIF
jgi:hypothetical protein